jgi:hypothetical protein
LKYAISFDMIDTDMKIDTEKVVLLIEKRFQEVAELEGDLGVFPLTKENHLQVKTNKEKSDTFGEVFTPLWLVDSMLERISDYDWRNPDKITMDLCAGYGQFTVRMIRKKFNLLGKKFDISKFLQSYSSDVREQPATHWFAELQFSSCYKLLYIYSTKINLAIGDAKELVSLPDGARGIMVFNFSTKTWEDKTEEVQNFIGRPRKYSSENEQKFVEFMESLNGS